MPILSGHIFRCQDGGIVNPLISNDLDEYSIDNYPYHGSDTGNKLNSGIVRSQPSPCANKVISGFLSESYFSDYYFRVHVEPIVVNFGNIIAPTERTLSVFNAYFDPAILDTVVISDPLVTIEPTVMTLGKLGESEIVVKTIPGGTNNLAATVQFNWFEKNSSVVTVIGTRLSIMTYQAEALWQEVWEWKTQVIESYNGAEQRIKLRNVPRVMLNTTYPIPASEKQKAQNRLIGWLGLRWLIPMWSEATKIFNVTSGSSILNVDLNDTELLEGGEALLWSSINSYEIINIIAVGGTTITLELPVGGNYAKGFVIPTRTGTIFQGAVRHTDGYSNKLDIPFKLDPIEPIYEDSYTQYLGFDVDTTINIAPNKGIISDNLVTRVDRIEYGTGVSETITPWNFNRIIRIYTVENKTHAETMAFKKWLFRRSGKFRPFWMPTFEHDFTLSMTGTVYNTLIVKNDYYKAFCENREFIAVKLKNGNWLFRKILSYVEGVSLDTLIVDSDLTVDSSEISVLCYLTFKRLDTDRVEIEYSNGLTTASIRTIEIEPLEAL